MTTIINADNGVVSGSAGLKTSADSTGVLALQTNGTTAVTVDTLQKVGIGTTSPQRTLSIANGGPSVEIDPAGIGSANPIYFNYNRSTSTYLTPQYWALAHIWNYGGGNEGMRLNSDGVLLVGTTTRENNERFRVYTSSFEAVRLSNPDLNGYTLLTKSQVTSASTHYVMGFLNFAGSVVGGITHNDTVTTYAVSSDYRLKNITGNLTGYKERLMALQPKQGTWLSNGSEFKGFIAHEFANSYSGSVIGKKDAVDADGKPIMQSMQASSSEVMADLVALMQEQQTMIESLKAEFDAYKATHP
jgi:hypothetical protein